jgi:hypothetical protein
MLNALSMVTDRTESGGKGPEGDSETSRACGMGKTESDPNEYHSEIVMSESLRML